MSLLPPLLLQNRDQPGRALRTDLNDAQADAVQILSILGSLHEQYLRSPIVREFTVSLLRGLENNDQPGAVNRIIAFVRKSMTYVRDPVDSEYVVAPDRLIRQWQTSRFMAGDCDDHVLLLNSMLGSVGVDTKFVGVKFGRTDHFNHVISGVVLDGQLFLVDPCSKFNPQPEYKETLIL